MVNYQKELEKVIEGLSSTMPKPKLVLHSCCAPCSTYVLEYLSQWFEIIVFYYNPNIWPKEEYEKRVVDQEVYTKKIAEDTKVSFMSGIYDEREFYAKIKGCENEKEGGKRCELCFEMRLKKTAECAKKLAADFFSTTLTISPMKNASLLNELGECIGQEEGVTFLPSDFKKKNGYKRSIELSKENDLYRQNYCGCVYSYKEMEERSSKV